MILNERQTAALERLVSYTMPDEHRHYEESQDSTEDLEDHIYHDIHTLWTALMENNIKQRRTT